MSLKRADLVAGKALAKAQSAENRLNALIGTSQNPNTATVLYTPSISVVTNSTGGGPYTWTCPAGVTRAVIECWGSGAGGGGGSPSQGGEGGGGGEYEQDPVHPVTPGTVYQFWVGTGGTGGVTGHGGQSGSDSVFDPYGNPVWGLGGNAGGGYIGGSGGYYNGETIDFAGGNGGGTTLQLTGGCGGGGSAGNSGGGGSGTSSAGSGGTAGGTAGAGGGAAGGAGGNAGNPGSAGSAPGGGGGGCGAATITGQFSKTYYFTTSGAFYGSDAIGGNANQRQNLNSTLYQGGESGGGGNYNGTAKSMLLLPSSVQSDLSGVIIDSVSLTLVNESTWYSTMTVVLGWTGYTNIPVTWNGSGINAVSQFQIGSGATLTQDLTNTGLGVALQNGTAGSLSLGPGTPGYNLGNFGSLYGISGGGAPFLTVTGHTGTTQVKAGHGANGQVRISYATPVSTVVASSQPTAVTDPVSGITLPAGHYVGPGAGITLASGAAPPAYTTGAEFVAATTAPAAAVIYANTAGNVAIAGSSGLVIAGAGGLAVSAGTVALAGSSITGAAFTSSASLNEGFTTGGAYTGALTAGPNQIVVDSGANITVGTNGSITNGGGANFNGGLGVNAAGGHPFLAGGATTATVVSIDGSANLIVGANGGITNNGGANFNAGIAFSGTAQVILGSHVSAFTAVSSCTFQEGVIVGGTGTNNTNNQVTIDSGGNVTIPGGGSLALNSGAGCNMNGGFEVTGQANFNGSGSSNVVFNPSIVAKNGINLGTSISDSMWLTSSGTGTVTFASGMTLHTENHPSGAGAFDAGGGPNTGTGYDGASGAWPQRVAVWGNSVEASLQNLITVVNNINTTLQDTGIFT